MRLQDVTDHVWGMGAREGRRILDVWRMTDRLWWFGRVEEGQWLYQQKPGWRPRGRAKRKRFMDGVKEDMKLVGVRSEDTEETVGWTQMNWWLAAATAKRISWKERKLMTHHFRNNAIMLTTHLYPYIRDCTTCKASKCNNLSVLVKENVPCFIFVSASGDLFK